MNQPNDTGFPEYTPPQESGDEMVEVVIASPWLRIAAYVINNIFTTIACIPMMVGGVAAVAGMSDLATDDAGAVVVAIFTSMWFIIGVAILLGYTVWQCVWMSKYGQSIGKRLLKIRVLKEDGSNPGFVGTVMLREVVFNLLIMLASGIVSAIGIVAIGENATMLSNLLSFAVWLACLVMLFMAGRDRRTLQDILAGTVVVKLPE